MPSLSLPIILKDISYRISTNHLGDFELHAKKHFDTSLQFYFHDIQLTFHILWNILQIHFRKLSHVKLSKSPEVDKPFLAMGSYLVCFRVHLTISIVGSHFMPLCLEIIFK